MTMDNDNPFITSPESGQQGRRGSVKHASSTTRLILFSNELPSGDLQDLFRRLHRCAKLPQYPLLASFLRQSAGVLRQEIQKQPRQLRESVPPFSDIITLVSHWDGLKNSPLGGAWEGALVCIYEIAMLIGYYETCGAPNHTEIKDNMSMITDTACLAGISVGLFSAAAVAVSTSLLDLVSYGAESARVAFTFGAHVGRCSQLLEPTATVTSPASWAFVVMGVPLEVVKAELDMFNGQQQDSGIAGPSTTTPLTQVSISHVDQASVGVTGPPSRLKELFRQSQRLGSSRHAPLPISGGLCHVPNVYDAHDVRAILETAGVRERWGSKLVQRPLLSPYTGAPFSASNACGLIEAICTEALTKPLYFDKLSGGAVMQLKMHSESSSFEILHYQTSPLTENIISSITETLSSSLETCVQRQGLVEWVMQNDSRFEQLHGTPGHPQESKLAVVGMSCRLPGGADTPERFWELLVDGRDTHTTIPPDRFDVDAHFDPSGETENTIGTRFGNFIDNPGHFDAGFFNMSPREAQQTDPMQRLALMTAYEALEMAGVVPNRTPSSHVSRVGTYYGQASDDYREVNASQRIGTYGIPGTERAFGNGRINYFFNFKGPSINIDTACSSGLAAVHAACSALWAGDADTVVAGGLNVITNPDIYCMLGKGHFLSKTGQCKVWDAGADGYCRADGVGSVVIKRLEDALADNDVVLATIAAGSTNHSAESISITQPHAGAQKDNYRQVLDKAGVNPLDVSFVELHGTGTQVGDAIESESVLDFFAPIGRRQRPKERLNLGAVKSNIGHGEAAAGIASLIKVLLMYRHGAIPPHIGIKTTMNDVVAQHLANRNAGMISGKSAPWLPISQSRGAKRYSVVNSFGAHGGNTTLLLEDAPDTPKSLTEQREESGPKAVNCEVVCVSAKSKASLRGNVAALLGYLDRHPETELKDVAYTTSARRIHHHIRIAASVSSVSQLRGFLKAALDDTDSHAKHVSTATKRTVVFAFSGQGCFYRGAAEQLMERAPTFRHLVLQIDRLALQMGLPSVLSAVSAGAATRFGDDAVNKTCPRSSTPSSTADETGFEAVASSIKSVSSMSASTEPETAAEEKDSPFVTQVATVGLQIALAQYLKQLGITPSAVIGHSLGEYAALVAADVLSVADALFLVGKRAQLMLAACEAGSHAMLSIRGASAARIGELCSARERKFHYDISCVNGRADTVVSGRREDMVALRDMLQGSHGLKCVLLDVPFAFHSAQMDPIVDDFEKAARYVTFQAPAIPVISPLLGQCVSKGGIIDATYLRRATREPVDFVSALDAVIADGLADNQSVWIDIGHHPVCTSFARNEKVATNTLASLRQGDNTLSTFTSCLATLHCLGLPVAWNDYFASREKFHRLLHLDSYQWNLKNYWIPYDTTWTLDKAHAGAKETSKSMPSPPFFTSSVQQVVLEEFDGTSGRMVALSNLAHPDLLGAANGHKINGRSVVTGSVWADVTLSIGEYMYKRMAPGEGRPYMNVKDMQVLEAQVLHDEDSSHFIQIQGVLDMSLKQTQVTIYAANTDGTRKTDKAFAMATVCYEDAQQWQAEWQIASHLVATRARSLWKLASDSGADDYDDTSNNSSRVSKLSSGAVYQLFANVVDYGRRYRGMQRVALAEGSQEATADILLDDSRHGTWHTPPHWIDSTFQLAGFVMNAFGVQGGSADTTWSSRDFFFITPGWRSFRLAEPLAPGPGVTYRNYVRMFPLDGEPGTFAGDIYLLRGERVVGVCAGIKFRRVPRALMQVMFPRQTSKRNGGGQNPAVPSASVGLTSSTTTGSSTRYANNNVQSPGSVTVVTPHTSVPVMASLQQNDAINAVQATEPIVSNQEVSQRAQAHVGGNTRVDACLQLIADETGLDLEDLSGDAAFAELGVDSLMSLALSDKMRVEFGIDVKASIFIEYATVQDLVNWLSKVAITSRN